jgi:hypothetical protein
MAISKRIGGRFTTLVKENCTRATNQTVNTRPRAMAISKRIGGRFTTLVKENCTRATNQTANTRPRTMALSKRIWNIPTILENIVVDCVITTVTQKINGLTKTLYHTLYVDYVITRLQVRGQGSRVEKDWSDYLDKHLGTEFLMGSDRSARSMGGCSLKRPDKLYGSIYTVEVDECDENQHMYANGNYSCEEKRLSELYDEPSIFGKN